MTSNHKDTTTSTIDASMQRLIVGLHGTPELKYNEKLNYLGEFRERIIRRLTKRQVAENFVFPQIEEALNHPKSSKLIIHGGLSHKFSDKYIKLARTSGKPYTKVHNPKLTGDTGLVVVSDDAVDIQNIDV